MRWIRSWPLVGPVLPAGRAHVVDSMPRLVMSDYDYSGLADVNDDVLLLEWDIAVSRPDMERFAELAALSPQRVLVAPYRLYYPEPAHWAHRHIVDPSSDRGERWVSEGDAYADYFSFGMIYLPRQLVLAFLNAPAPERGRPPHVPPFQYGDSRMHDQTFSVWHKWRADAGPVPIAWNVRPVHLHYEMRYTA